MKNYSQNNEQEVLLAHFKDKTGLFVDIGANDGETLSNTRALALLGWSGVCIEPNIKAFDRLFELYKDNPLVSCLNGAVAEKNGIESFLVNDEHLGKGDTGLLSTLSPAETKRWNGVKFDETPVQCFTWSRIVKMFELDEIEFINIDAEGMDYTILKQIDLSKVSCICIEHNSNKEHKQLILNYCEHYGLTKVLLDNFENIILAR